MNNEQLGPSLAMEVDRVAAAAIAARGMTAVITRKSIAQDAADESRRLCATLTELQRETLILLCNGLTVQDVAEREGVTYWTVSERARAILHKLGVASRIESAVIATKAGLV